MLTDQNTLERLITLRTKRLLLKRKVQENRPKFRFPPMKLHTITLITTLRKLSPNLPLKRPSLPQFHNPKKRINPKLNLKFQRLLMSPKRLQKSLSQSKKLKRFLESAKVDPKIVKLRKEKDEDLKIADRDLKARNQDLKIAKRDPNSESPRDTHLKTEKPIEWSVKRTKKSLELIERTIAKL